MSSDLKPGRCQMKVRETIHENIPRTEHAATRQEPDASQRLLATLTILVLTSSVISMGVFMVVLARAVPMISLVAQAQAR